MPARKYEIENNRDMRESCQADLQGVTTLAEAIVIYNKTRKAIQTQIDKGRIPYRKAGNTVLVSVQALDLIWNRLPQFEGDL